MKLGKGKDKNFIDLTWLPMMLESLMPRAEEDFSGRVPARFIPTPHSAPSGSSLVNPNFINLDYAEDQMMKSGAKLPDILFRRAYRKASPSPVNADYRDMMERRYRGK